MVLHIYINMYDSWMLLSLTQWNASQQGCTLLGTCKKERPTCFGPRGCHDLEAGDQVATKCTITPLPSGERLPSSSTRTETRQGCRPNFPHIFHGGGCIPSKPQKVFRCSLTTTGRQQEPWGTPFQVRAGTNCRSLVYNNHRCPFGK